MLSALTVTATVTEKSKSPVTITWDESAMTLLSFLQQCWPSVDPSPGIGTVDLPYMPRTPAQWFYCAKVKGSGSTAKRFPNQTSDRAWFKVGGRYVAVDPTSLYASDYGTTKSAIDVNSPVLANPTYPTLSDAITAWKVGHLARTDFALTHMLRTIMRKDPVIGMPDALPALAVVLFISEVARNHTAFHTNLMALDLIQSGAKLRKTSGTIPWTWSNALWIKDACPVCATTGTLTCDICPGTGWTPVVCDRCTSGWYGGSKCRGCNGTGRYRNQGCNRCGGTGWYKQPVQCNKCSGTGRLRRKCNGCRDGLVKCTRCKGKGEGTVFDEFIQKGVVGGKVKGGGQALQNGLLPMSHKGSAFGAAFDLVGEGTYQFVKGGESTLEEKNVSPLLVVRRKEATVMIQWLHMRVMDIGMEAELDDDTKIEVTTAIKAADLSLDTVDFDEAYTEVEELLVGYRDPKEEDTRPLEERVKELVRHKMLWSMQTRADAFMYALEGI